MTIPLISIPPLVLLLGTVIAVLKSPNGGGGDNGLGVDDNGGTMDVRNGDGADGAIPVALIRCRNPGLGVVDITPRLLNEVAVALRIIVLPSRSTQKYIQNYHIM